MDITKLIAVVTILLTLSLATESLVEIIKGFFRSLSQGGLQGAEEAKRKAKISALAVACGIFTAFLSSPILSGLLADMTSPGEPCKFALGILEIGKPNASCVYGNSTTTLIIVSLGFLASGGSKFWNSVLEYLLQIKNLKEKQVRGRGEQRAANQ